MSLPVPTLYPNFRVLLHLKLRTAQPFARPAYLEHSALRNLLFTDDESSANPPSPSVPGTPAPAAAATAAGAVADEVERDREASCA